MPARVHMSRRELEDLIEKTKAQGNDANLLEQLLAETTPEKPANRKPRSIIMEKREALEELITSPEELERLRSLACPHIRNSPYWEEFVAHRILVCTTCKELHPGEFGEHRQPPLF